SDRNRSLARADAAATAALSRARGGADGTRADDLSGAVLRRCAGHRLRAVEPEISGARSRTRAVRPLVDGRAVVVGLRVVCGALHAVSRAAAERYRLLLLAQAAAARPAGVRLPGDCPRLPARQRQLQRLAWRGHGRRSLFDRRAAVRGLGAARA